ncbi:unnamed protein product [Polarella glacialis]|uniref:Bifunctional lysine-specific demethylase and histidyl-hydroxylase n=1 Tax=Polarella glacialis TaxID=89957 RepID=A0A813IKI7_POLGL|nr:unnamed protein product [Polarella glacialis]
MIPPVAGSHRQCEECHQELTSVGGRKGEPGTVFASHWYCDRCWSSWETISQKTAAELRSQRLLSQREPLRQALSLAAGELSVSGQSLPRHWQRLLGSRSSWKCAAGEWRESFDQVSHEMDIRSMADSLRPRVQRLWNEVLPQLQHGGSSSSGSGVKERLDGFESYFSTLASSGEFRELWAGLHGPRGPFVLPSCDLVRNALSLHDVVHGLAAPVDPRHKRRKPCETALTLTDGGDFRCPVGLPPVRTVEELLQVLQYGTVFLNTASLHWRSAAEICLAASSVLHFPANINIYVTGRGRKVSTDVHTDNHDVLILHTEGAKHWRVYAPPARAEGLAHPLYRGKNEDKLDDSELGEPLIDVVLRPGEVLFVPMGFPHATSTLDTGDSEVSVHMTLGISTADYDFSLGGLRKALLQDLAQDAKLDEPQVPDEAFWRLLSPIPVGNPVAPAQVFGVANHRQS